MSVWDALRGRVVVSNLESSLHEHITNQVLPRRVGIAVLLMVAEGCGADCTSPIGQKKARDWIMRDSEVLDFWCSAAGVPLRVLRMLHKELEGSNTDVDPIRKRLMAFVEIPSGSTNVGQVHRAEGAGVKGKSSLCPCCGRGMPSMEGLCGLCQMFKEMSDADQANS